MALLKNLDKVIWNMEAALWIVVLYYFAAWSKGLQEILIHFLNYQTTMNKFSEIFMQKYLNKIFAAIVYWFMLRIIQVN